MSASWLNENDTVSGPVRRDAEEAVGVLWNDVQELAGIEATFRAIFDDDATVVRESLEELPKATDDIFLALIQAMLLGAGRLLDKQQTGNWKNASVHWVHDLCGNHLKQELRERADRVRNDLMAVQNKLAPARNKWLAHSDRDVRLKGDKIATTYADLFDATRLLCEYAEIMMNGVCDNRVRIDRDDTDADFLVDVVVKGLQTIKREEKERLEGVMNRLARQSP